MTLYVVSCTKRKIWDDNPATPKNVRAANAYRGTRFLKWLESPKSPWIILSAKYGLIDPRHWITNYNVTFGSGGEISDRELNLQGRDWFFAQTPDDICAVNCDPIYVEKIKRAFPNMVIKEVQL